uniref:C-type lectin domain family 4 member E-like n=1 Tax=Centroberyx gerrardi TaxID=166262 RepID=UPI003AAE5B31
MEEIYMNVEPAKSSDSRTSTKQTGPSSSDRSSHGAALLGLGLLSVFLLAALIGLGVRYQDVVRGFAVDLSVIQANLTEERLVLQASNDKLSSLTEERDLLNTHLTAMTKERDRLQSLSRKKKTCPAGWRMFSCVCYLLSTETKTWDNSRQDCRDRGADLVVIDSAAEQTFLSTLTNGAASAWIGLSDRDMEGTWKWIDETPLTEEYWESAQPDNGGGNPRWGEEDCAHIITGKTKENWNDQNCANSLRWICEEVA